jgi:hypothetical protein
VRAGVLDERAGAQWREHVRCRPGAAEQAEHGAAAPRPALAAGPRDAVGHDADRTTGRSGEHQSGDQHRRGRAHQCRAQCDRAESGDHDVDQRRVSSRADRDERGAHHDVADSARREDQAGRARRHAIAVQPTWDQQLRGAAQRAGDHQRAGPCDHPAIAQQTPHRHAGRLGLRARRRQAIRPPGRACQSEAHDRARRGDQGERQSSGGSGGQQTAERGADHRAHR